MSNQLDLIKNLQQAEAVYVLISGYTRMPYVVCDEETFDDEVLIFFNEEEAKQAAKNLLEGGDLVHIAKVEQPLFLQFYTGLFPMGVNCLRIGKGTKDETTLQNSDLVRRPGTENIPEGKVRVENPEFHLTALYFSQAFRKSQGAPMADGLKEIYDEMLVHFQKGQYIIPTHEEQGIPILKHQEGQAFIPLFTDLQEFQKFNREDQFKGAVVAAEKVPDFMSDEMTGVVVNPFGVNLILNMKKRNA